MRELNVNEVQLVNGGMPWIAGVAAYVAIIDYAMDFGKGLGAGLYDALN